jgi:hypothetical protein
MAKERPVKDNHLLFADSTGSRGKSGVWFGEQQAFKAKQAEVMNAVKDSVSFVPLDGAVLAISVDPPGICVIAPNPSLPGIIVLADGATPETTTTIKSHHIDVVRKAITANGLTADTDLNDRNGEELENA